MSRLNYVFNDYSFTSSVTIAQNFKLEKLKHRKIQTSLECYAKSNTILLLQIITSNINFSVPYFLTSTTLTHISLEPLDTGIVSLTAVFKLRTNISVIGSYFFLDISLSTHYNVRGFIWYIFNVRFPAKVVTDCD